MRIKKRYKAPFNITVIWHPAFKKGIEVADFIYNSFCRDTEAPLNRSIGIPVYYRSLPPKDKKRPLPISLQDSDYNAVIVLIDDYFFNDDDWNECVRELIPKTNSKIRIFPIAFSNHHFKCLSVVFLI